MYNKAMIFLVGYIENSITGLEAFDATETFSEPDNFASIYIIDSNPTSQHSHTIKQEQKDEDTKVFTYKQNENLVIRVDFRGSNCHANMATFKSSFLQEKGREFLKEAGFSFFGLGSEKPISSLRNVKIKKGLSITLKLKGSYLVEDESQIIKNVNIKVSSNLN